MDRFMIKRFIATMMHSRSQLVLWWRQPRGSTTAEHHSTVPPEAIQPDQRGAIIGRLLPWWVEVNTSIPLCTYYFGPFDYPWEARGARAGYVEDLEAEGARDIVALVKQCQPPSLLTVDHGYYSATGQHH
jgi:Domain of unknown function (DUF1816)